jgi:signal transduction histidine kinase
LRPSFRDASIKTKLVLASVLGCGAALLIAGAVITSYDLVGLRRSLVQRMTVQADIVGANCLSALLFNDSKSATDTLAALRADPAVLAAGLYTPDRRLFATYSSGPSHAMAPTGEGPIAAAQGHRLEKSRLLVSRSILFDREAIGTLIIVSDLGEISAKMTRDVTIVAAVLVVSLLVALVISSRLQRHISEPMLHLAETARRISLEKDFSVRASGESRNEIGALVRAFNEMLEEIRKQEAALRSVHDELEQRVADRTAQLETANRELEAFSYSVSHDLRAPLRSIDGFSQALLEDSADKLDDQSKKHLQRTRAAAKRMGQLIDDLLGLSRLSRGELKRAPVDLTELARTTAMEIFQSEPERKVELKVAEGLVAQADGQLLNVVLENLLRNAWKFTRIRGVAHIEFGSLQQDGTRVFFLRDDGVGFDMAYAEKLFGAFQRLHSAKEFEGTGIGLATVARIIRRHGGKVWAEAEIEKGATFYFTLEGSLSRSAA